MLTGHAKHLILPQSPIRDFTQKHSGKIAALVSIIFFVGTIAACFITADNLANEQLKLVADLLNTQNALDLKLNKLLQIAAEGFWGKYFFSVFVFVIFSFVASVLLGIWTETSADTKRPSYILLTKKSEQTKIEKDQRYKFRWLSFVGSITVAIVTGILSNILFTKYWAG